MGPEVKFVNLQQMGSALRSEFSKSPKKTAVLGCICLVAVYLWAPLVWGWLPKRTSVIAAPGQERLDQDAAPEIVEDSPINVVGSESEWDEPVRWMERDPYMESAVLPDDVRNPFAPSEQQLAESDRRQDAEELPPDVAPAQLGLSLSSTIVGRRCRGATINGKAYLENSRIVVALQTQTRPIEFTVTRIQPQSVVLVRDGKAYELKLKPAHLVSGNVTIGRSPRRGGN